MMHEIDLSRADLNLLVLFETVLEERHVGRAAERMNLSPSAVSHGLSRLRRLLNDPLFLKIPKGVVATDRALELAGPIADVLARVRRVLSTAEPFDPATSRRRFALGAPDGVSAVVLAPLLDRLATSGPGIDVAVRQLLPAAGETTMLRAWSPAFADLDSRAIDIAIIPSDDIPPRFDHWTVFEEDFIVAVRQGHPLAEHVTLDRYCEMEHLVVSMSGDPHGFVDQLLAAEGRTRRIALTLPNFMFALAVVADSDLVCALPRRFARMHAERFGIVAVEAPFPMASFKLNAVLPKSASADLGLRWLADLLPRAG
jgi:DNA-binding transcriptional LysR family regulator